MTDGLTMSPIELSWTAKNWPGKLPSLQKAVQEQDKVSCSWNQKVLDDKLISANGCKTLGTFFLTHNYGNYENVEALR